MARPIRSPRSHLTTGPTSDFLMILRCDEASGNLVDETGQRPMTISGAPASVGSLTLDTPSIGARSFTGVQHATRAADTGDAASVFQNRFGWGASVLVQQVTTGTQQIILELGQFAGASGSNTQMRIGINAVKDATFQWRHAGGMSLLSSTGGLMIEGEIHQVGVTFRADPDQIDAAIVELYIDGRQVARAKNQPWPTGGNTTARWIVAASYEGGGAANTPALHFQGSIDDVAVTRWPPDPAWHRSVWARAQQDWLPYHQAAGIRGHSVFSRVLVQVDDDEVPLLARVDGSWVNLCDVGSSRINFLRGYSIKSEIDDVMMGADVELIPRFGEYNLSPFVATRAGGDVNPFSTASVEPDDNHLLRYQRRIRIESCTCPLGMLERQAQTHMQVLFDGFIADVNAGVDDVSLQCLDKGAALQCSIEPSVEGGDRRYGLPGGSPIEVELQKIIDDNAPNRFEVVSGVVQGYGIKPTGAAGTPLQIDLLAWQNLIDINARGRPHVFVPGDKIRVSNTTNFNGIFTVATVDGIGAGLGPQRIRTVEVVTGAAEETGLVVGVTALAYHRIGVPRLYGRNGSPGSVFEWLEPASKSILSAIDDVAQSFASWRVKWLWSDVAQEFRLTLHDPGATPLAAQKHTIHDVMGVGKISSDGRRIRNVWTTEVSPTAAADSAGAPVSAIDAAGIDRMIYAVPRVDVESARRYGRETARVRVASDSLINTMIEAAALSDRAINDLSMPMTTLEVDCMIHDRIEVGDAVTTAAPPPGFAPVQFAGARTGFVTAVEHRHDVGGATSVVSLRDVVEGAAIRRTVRSPARAAAGAAGLGAVPARGLTPPRTPVLASCTAIGILAGVKEFIIVRWPRPSRDLSRRYLRTEIYASQTSGFTPSAATYRGSGEGDTGTIPLPNSGTWYVQIRHVDDNGNYSGFSGQFPKA